MSLTSCSRHPVCLADSFVFLAFPATSCFFKCKGHAPFALGLRARFYTCPIPYHLGESLQGREVYRYLERTSDLELAMAAHMLKLDRYRED